MCEAGSAGNNTPPQLLTLGAFGGDWDRYIDAVYQCYIAEIVQGNIEYRGLPIRCQFRPVTKGKHFAFWHIISEGPDEEDRTPDFSRCERIGWIPWVIKNAGKNDKISYWENRRGSNRNIVLWYEEGEFAVILAKRSGYLLLKTAYCVSPHRKMVFRRERDEYRGKNG
jgi:hypothetical protein